MIYAEDEVRDIPDRRVLDLDNGNKAIFDRTGNPYGFWTFHFEKGGKPGEISGSYTTYDLAVQAFNKYLDNKNTKRYTEVNVKKPKATKDKLFDKE